MSFLWDTSPPDGGGVTVLDDFEDGDASNWSGMTATQSTVLEGSWSAQLDTTFSSLASDIATPRGYEYRCLIQFSTFTTSTTGWIATNIQGSDSVQDSYYAYMDNWDLGVVAREGGSSAASDTTTFSQRTAGTTYQLGIRVEASDVTAVVYDESGTELATAGPITNSTHTGGVLGPGNGGDNAPTFDYYTQRPLP